MFIFNDTLLIQALTLLTLLLVIWSTELFYTSLNSILFLLTVSLYMYTLNLDILVNFLIIIDLGLFFALTALVLNFSILYSSTLGLIFTSARFTYKFTLVCVFLLVLKFVFGLGVTSWFFTEVPEAFLIQENFYFNWLNVVNSFYPNDLAMMSDVYFNFNFGEFVILNFLLYLAILVSYLLIIMLKSLNILSSTPLKTNFKLPTLHFFKTQGFQKQVMQSASVRVWSKGKEANRGFTKNLN